MSKIKISTLGWKVYNGVKKSKSDSQIAKGLVSKTMSMERKTFNNQNNTGTQKTEGVVLIKSY